MDDMTLVADTADQLQTMLNIANSFGQKWQLKFSPRKSKVMIVNSANPPPCLWFLGDIRLEVCTTYRYLNGEYVTHDLLLNEHLDSKRNQLEAMLSACLSVTQNETLSLIKMQTLLKLHHQCLMPAMLYSCENWGDTSKYNQKINQIQIISLRRILAVPNSTPILGILAETGCHPLEILVDRRQLNYLWKLLNCDQLKEKVVKIQISQYTSNNLNWVANIKNLFLKYKINITFKDVEQMSQSSWKNITKKLTTEYSNKKFHNEALKLKKLKLLISFKQTITKEQYIESLNRSMASIIFKTRTRMLPLNNNIGATSISCPLCLNGVDDEVHLMSECSITEPLRIKFTINTHEEVMSTNTTVPRFKEIATFIKEALLLRQ